MKRLYVCYWNPNGTNDILVTIDNEIVDSLPEALFGVNVRIDSRIDVQPIACEDFITMMSSSDENFGEYTLVEEIDAESAMTRIAINPVSDGSTASAFIAKHFDVGGDQ